MSQSKSSQEVLGLFTFILGVCLVVSGIYLIFAVFTWLIGAVVLIAGIVHVAGGSRFHDDTKRGVGFSNRVKWLALSPVPFMILIWLTSVYYMGDGIYGREPAQDYAYFAAIVLAAVQLFLSIIFFRLVKKSKILSADAT